MISLLRSGFAAAVVVSLCGIAAHADNAKFQLKSGEVAHPSALAAGEQYLSVSKALECENATCTGKIKGRAKKQTLITQISCLTIADNSEASYGAVVSSASSGEALAVFPVTSRSLSGTTEYAVVSGPVQVVIGPDESVVVGIQGTTSLSQSICSLTGTTTKQ